MLKLPKWHPVFGGILVLHVYMYIPKWRFYPPAVTKIGVAFHNARLCLITIVHVLFVLVLLAYQLVALPVRFFPRYVLKLLRFVVLTLPSFLICCETR